MYEITFKLERALKEVMESQLLNVLLFAVINLLHSFFFQLKIKILTILN